MYVFIILIMIRGNTASIELLTNHIHERRRLQRASGILKFDCCNHLTLKTVV